MHVNEAENGVVYLPGRRLRKLRHPPCIFHTDRRGE